MTYYDPVKYADAKAKFAKFLQECKYEAPPKLDIGPLEISTITNIGKIAPSIDILTLYSKLELSDQIIYIKYCNNIKGNCKTAKTKKKQNQLFSNQISIGMKCSDSKHVHKNPVCGKLFKNGMLQCTGCKSLDEIEMMYNMLRKILIRCGIEAYEFDKTNVQLEMINATFYVSIPIDLQATNCLLSKEYEKKDIFCIQGKSSPLSISLKSLGYFDEKKKKDKVPSVFIYNTGAINIIATKLDILEQSYKLLVEILTKHWKVIAQKKIVYPHF